MKTLLPYQAIGAKLMSERRRLYNADQPGLGKTLQALEALRLLGNPPVAVLCPAIARSGWKREAAEHGITLWYVESYDGYVRSEARRQALVNLAPGVLILDEAHMLGNLHSQRTFELLGPKGPVREAAMVWPLSGTPLRRGPATLFPVLACCWPEALRARKIRSYREYLDRYTNWYEDPTFGVRTRPGVRHPEEFKALWQSIALRRLQQEVLPELPSMTWQNVILDARPSGATAALASFVDSLQSELRDAVEYGLLENAHTATLRRLIGIAKAPSSVEVIKEDLEGGTEKVFVLAYHREVLDILQEGLAEFGVERIDGSTSDAERSKRQLAFQTNPARRVFLGQIVAVQMSVTLTAASICHMVEPTWVDDDNTQAAKRIHRIGQMKPVIVRVHTLADTLDEQVNDVILRTQRGLQQATGEAAPLRQADREVRVP